MSSTVAVMGKTNPGAPKHSQQSQVLVLRNTPGVHIEPRHGGFRVRRPRARWARRHRVQRRPGAGDQPDRHPRIGIRHLPGPARAGPDPSLHAADRDGGTGDRPDVPARGVQGGLRTAARRPGCGAGVGRRIARAGGAVAAACTEDRLADGHRRQSRRADRDSGDQDRRAVDSGVDHRQSHPGAWGGRGQPEDTPLPGLWAAARALRLADGPDEVHRRSLARTELARHSNVPDVGPDEPPSERIQEN